MQAPAVEEDEQAPHQPVYVDPAIDSAQTAARNDGCLSDALGCLGAIAALIREIAEIFVP